MLITTTIHAKQHFWQFANPRLLLRQIFILVTASSLLAMGNLATATDDADILFPEIQPSPAYTADEVVGIQMRALGNNDSPQADAGIALTYRFASPGNKRNTGPLERFSTLFENAAYKPMINHANLEIGESSLIDSIMYVPVIITDHKGEKAGYMFYLSKQQGDPYHNCWMTDKVIRVRLPKSSSEIL